MASFCFHPHPRWGLLFLTGQCSHATLTLSIAKKNRSELYTMEGAMSVIEFSDPEEQRAYEKRKKNFGIVYWILVSILIGCGAYLLLFR